LLIHSGGRTVTKTSECFANWRPIGGGLNAKGIRQNLQQEDTMKILGFKQQVCSFRTAHTLIPKISD
jgi:hypothetical protein